MEGLETQLKGDKLVARVDSGDMLPRVTYEFQAEAIDQAGNAKSDVESRRTANR